MGAIFFRLKRGKPPLRNSALPRSAIPQLTGRTQHLRPRGILPQLAAHRTGLLGRSSTCVADLLVGVARHVVDFMYQPRQPLVVVGCHVYICISLASAIPVVERVIASST